MFLQRSPDRMPGLAEEIRLSGDVACFDGALAVYPALAKQPEDLVGGDPRRRHRGDVVDGVGQGGVDVSSALSGPYAGVEEEDQVGYPSEYQEGEERDDDGADQEFVGVQRVEDLRDRAVIRYHLGNPENVGQNPDERGGDQPHGDRGDVGGREVGLKRRIHPGSRQVVSEADVLPALRLQVPAEQVETEPFIPVH